MINNKFIIAHRGASLYEKENTMEAFKLAVKLKTDMIELDVRKTKDSELIVFHDKKIGKKFVNEMSHEEMNNTLGYNVSSLKEVLKYFKGIVKLDIHLKEEGYEEEFIHLILKYLDLKDFFICSEIPSSLEKIKKICPQIKTGLILGAYFSDILFFVLNGFRKRGMLKSSVDILIPRWQLANFILLNRAKKYSKKVIPWGIRSKKIAEKFLKEDVVMGIVTNKPDLMKK
jgi:glycerophosphoryl diester phosphodiesterase